MSRITEKAGKAFIKLVSERLKKIPSTERKFQQLQAWFILFGSIKAEFRSTPKSFTVTFYDTLSTDGSPIHQMSEAWIEAKRAPAKKKKVAK